MTALQAARALADDLAGIFGTRLQAVVVFGTHARPHPRVIQTPVQTLALVTQLEYADLAASAELAGTWQGRGLDMPLLLPTGRIPAQPGRVSARVRGHPCASHPRARRGSVRRPCGAPEDLRRACEVNIRSHAIHLREGFLLAAQQPRKVADLIVSSAAPFASLIQTFALVTGAPPQSPPDALASHVGRVAGLDRDLLARLLRLEEDHTLDPGDAVQLYPPYLDVMQGLLRVIDGWVAEGTTA